ncbi:MAG TPA: hypothetical protein VGM88_30960 [Kofleriaceae bacterium]|jgi:hypothetical protein
MRATWVVGLAALAACTADPAALPDGATQPPDAAAPDAPRPDGYDEWAAVCAHGYRDELSPQFCSGSGPPHLDSLHDLEQLVRLDNVSETYTFMLGESSALGLRSVTPMNPRAFFVSDSVFQNDPQYRVMTFARGEPFVELVANDLATRTLHFFLIRFHLPCEANPGGCTYADLMLPSVESGWTGYELYDDSALVNTPLDCNTCHQPNGPGTPKILRMQERLGEWDHWIGGDGGWGLFESILDDSGYAGQPMDIWSWPNSPSALQQLVEQEGFAPQPNEFVSETVESELEASGGTSATWDGLYANAVAGLDIPPPYYGQVQVDYDQAFALIDTYKQVVAGTLPPSALPDFQSTLRPDAPAAMSIRPAPGLDGRGILVHMCSQCHNARLDQTLTRALFNPSMLDTMSTAERHLATVRLMLPDTDPKKMPPPRFRELSDDERALALGALSDP